MRTPRWHAIPRSSVDQLGDEELAERVRAASEHAAAPGEIKVEIKGE